MTRSRSKTDLAQIAEDAEKNAGWPTALCAGQPYPLVAREDR